MSRSHRRAFLKAVGTTLAALPFYRMLEDNFAASAGGAALPLKLIGIYHPHGISSEYHALRPGESEGRFDLTYPGCSLQPFDDPGRYGKSFKDRILVIEGMDLRSNANGHDSAATILTGSNISDDRPLNLSLDQYLAVECGLGDATPVTSIALGVGDPELAAGYGLSFGPGGHPLSKVIDPVQTFDTLFRGVLVGDDPAARAAAARQQRRGKSVLDFLRKDVNRLRARLAAEEQHKLDQHLYSLRQIEKQLDGVVGARRCGTLVRPGPLPALERRSGGGVHFDAITDLQIDLLAQAVACDITRFATLFLADLPYPGNPLGLPADMHGAVAHTYLAREHGGTSERQMPLAKLNAYSFGKIARLMQQLDELGALDSTLLYASSDMGNPAAHSTNNVPTLLAGGANGKLRMGRRVRLAGTRNASDDESKQVPNNKLLVTIAQAFGAQIDAFGTQTDPAYAQGALSELT